MGRTNRVVHSHPVTAPSGEVSTLLTTTWRLSARHRLCSSVWVGHEPEHLLDGGVDLDVSGHRRRHRSSLRLPSALGRVRFHQTPPTIRYPGPSDSSEGGSEPGQTLSSGLLGVTWPSFGCRVLPPLSVDDSGALSRA